MGYTLNTILRQLLGNPGVNNVKEELLTQACEYGDGQMEANTGKTGWVNTDAYYGAAVGIAYKFAQAWATTGNDQDAERSESFKEAMDASKELKTKLTSTGLSGGSVIVQVDPDDNREYFGVSPYGPGGISGHTSTSANWW